MPAQLWRPPAGIGPGVVVVQEIFGVSEYVQARGRDLAALGYWSAPRSLLAARRSRDRRRPGASAAGDGDGSAAGLAAAVRDGLAALSHVRGMIEVEGGVGLLGFCFGGGLAFNVAAVTRRRPGLLLRLGAG